MLTEKKHLNSLLVFLAVIIAGGFLYVRALPEGIAFQFYDPVGYFSIFGLLGLAAHYLFEKKSESVFGRILPIGPTLVIGFAFITESIGTFANGNLNLGNLFWGILGVLFFLALAGAIGRRKQMDIRFFVQELFYFTVKELRSVLFPALILFSIFISNYIPLGNFYRYDVLFVAAILIQFLLVFFKLETKDEAKTILLFHIIGLCLELFKTHPSVGSWSYPEPGILKIADVPLFSGFMYAAVGSYIAHAWRMFKLRLVRPPLYSVSLMLCFFIYLNFFTNHYIYDYRLFLFAAIFIIYYRTDVYFTPRLTEYRMPLGVSFLLIGFFVWIAENIATFYGAWKYPGQIHAWEVVSFQKITSWFLLVIICFIVVSYLKHFKEAHKKGMKQLQFGNV